MFHDHYILQEEKTTFDSRSYVENEKLSLETLNCLSFSEKVAVIGYKHFITYNSLKNLSILITLVSFFLNHF